MSVQPPAPDNNLLNEAPAIAWTTLHTKTGGKINLTIRSLSGREALDELVETVMYAQDKYHFSVSPAYPPRDEPSRTEPLPDTLPDFPAPPPAAPAPTNGPREAHCVLIEIGTSYSGGKTQLKFTCDGLEHPLTFTKPVSEMVKLLAPLGYTAEHLVVGKKYGANATVRYTENDKDGKTYKNVVSVAPR